MSTTVPFPTPRDHGRATFTPRAADQGNGVAIVVDNGSHHVRAGLSNRDDPDIIFRSVVSRFKSKAQGDTLWVGGSQLDAKRYYCRTAFERDVVVNFDVQETILDHIFTSLHIRGDHVDRPVVMTETLCNIPMSRARMSELLFECYGVPGVTYGVDSLFSYLHSARDMSDGIVVSAGHTTTSVIPIFDGRAHLDKASRLNLGGGSVTDYLIAALGLQYPQHRSIFTTTAVEEIVHRWCEVSPNYTSDLYTYANCDNDNTGEASGKMVVLQLPFVAPAAPRELTDEEKAAKLERQRENGRRLQEMAKKKRAETLAKNEATLAELEDILKLKGKSKAKFNNELESRNLNEASLTAMIKKLTKSVNKAKGIIHVEEPTPEPVYDLIDRPDSELSEAEKKEKKKQIFLRNTNAGRARQREKRAAEEEAKATEKKALMDRFAADPDAVIHELQTARGEVRTRQEERKKRRSDLSNRRSDASRARMRAITQAAFANPDDNFGKSDSDWQLYLDMQKGGNDSESEEDAEVIRNLDAQLLELAPQLFDDDGVMIEGDARSQSPFIAVPIEEQHQVRLTVNRIRAPEILFQPLALAGHQQGGLVDLLQNTFVRLSPAQGQRVARNIYLTGGHTRIKGFEARIRSEILAMRPYQSAFNVIPASDPCLDAWRGAAAFARDHCTDVRGTGKSGRIGDVYMSKAEWEEGGAEYFKEHRASNRYYEPTNV